MKQSAHLKITNASAQAKILVARQLKQKQQYYQSIKLYTKGIFLKEDPIYISQLAQIYESILDLSTALNLHKRAQQLRSVQNEKVRSIALTKGFNLMDSGSMKNILFDCEYTEFKKAYPAFRNKLKGMAEEDGEIGENLMNCLGFLETDYRMFALEELTKCLGKKPKQVELIVLHALIKWSLCRMAEGYKLFWEAYEIAPEDAMVLLFLRLINPKLETMYKQTQYLLIDNKIERCLINIKKALELHPHHTNFLIVKAYIHRTRQQYEAALCDLQLANKTLKDTSLQPQLRNQIALTYNQMGSFLFKKKKFTQAIALFNEGITFKPKDWGMRANRGDCYKALNDYTKALEDYLLAYSLSGDVPEMNFRLGTIYNSRGIANFNNKNPRQAIIQFSQAIKYCKNHSQFYINRAKSLVQLSKIPQAVTDFQQALKYDPNNTEAQKYLLQYKPQEIKPPRRKP